MISGPFTESPGKSFETLARQSVSQANHDLAGRVQPNWTTRAFVLVLGSE